MLCFTLGGKKLLLKIHGLFLETWSGRSVSLYDKYVPHDSRLV